MTIESLLDPMDLDNVYSSFQDHTSKEPFLGKNIMVLQRQLPIYRDAGTCAQLREHHPM
jgi:hypothetical protein